MKRDVLTYNTLYSEQRHSQTRFALGNSKFFTALGLGLLVEDDAHNMGWETTIRHVLPHQWRLQDEVADKYASLIDILSHRTGLPPHDLSYSRTDTLGTLVSFTFYRC